MWPFRVGILAPFGIVYIFNMIMFVIILISVLRHRNRNTDASKWKKAANNITVSLVLATMFGVGWIFGVLGSPALRFGAVVGGVFQYTFIAVAGFQGFMFFLLFPCRSKHAREVWKKWFYYAICRSRIYKDNLRVLKTYSKGKNVKNSSATPADGNLNSQNPASAGNENADKDTFTSIANRFGVIPHSTSSNTYENSGRIAGENIIALGPLSDSNGIEPTPSRLEEAMNESVIDSESHACTVSSFKPASESTMKEQIGTNTPDERLSLGNKGISLSYSSGTSHSPCVLVNYHAHNEEN